MKGTWQGSGTWQTSGGGGGLVALVVVLAISVAVLHAIWHAIVEAAEIAALVVVSAIGAAALAGVTYAALRIRAYVLEQRARRPISVRAEVVDVFPHPDSAPIAAPRALESARRAPAPRPAGRARRDPPPQSAAGAVKGKRSCDNGGDGYTSSCAARAGTFPGWRGAVMFAGFRTPGPAPGGRSEESPAPGPCSPACPASSVRGPRELSGLPRGHPRRRHRGGLRLRALRGLRRLLGVRSGGLSRDARACCCHLRHDASYDDSGDGRAARQLRPRRGDGGRIKAGLTQRHRALPGDPLDNRVPLRERLLVAPLAYPCPPQPHRQPRRGRIGALRDALQALQLDQHAIPLMRIQRLAHGLYVSGLAALQQPLSRRGRRAGRGPPNPSARSASPPLSRRLRPPHPARPGRLENRLTRQSSNPDPDPVDLLESLATANIASRNIVSISFASGACGTRRPRRGISRTVPCSNRM